MATPKGYTSVQLVADELGDAFDDNLVDQCSTLIAQAEAYIDRYTGRAWAVASPITDELHTVVSPYLYLTFSPVTAITSFKVRLGAVGAADTVLTAGTQYELIDGPHGIVLVNASYPFGFDVVVNTTEYAGYIAKVSYTASTPVPADIEHAATLLVAEWMLRRSSGATQVQQAVAAGIKSYSIGNELSVTFGDGSSSRSSTASVASASVTDILNRHRAILMA